MAYSTPLVAPKLLFFYLRLPQLRGRSNPAVERRPRKGYRAAGSERLSSPSTSSLMMDVASARA